MFKHSILDPSGVIAALRYSSNTAAEHLLAQCPNKMRCSLAEWGEEACLLAVGSDDANVLHPNGLPLAALRALEGQQPLQQGHQGSGLHRVVPAGCFPLPHLPTEEQGLVKAQDDA